MFQIDPPQKKRKKERKKRKGKQRKEKKRKKERKKKKKLLKNRIGLNESVQSVCENNGHMTPRIRSTHVQLFL